MNRIPSISTRALNALNWSFIALVSLASVSAAEESKTPEAARPNIIIILADDLGYGDLGCYSDTGVPTPHLDRLAREGMRFTDFHSSGPVCSPTRAGLLTGRYQQRAGIAGVVFADPKRNRHHGLHTDETTLFEILHQAGYQTAMFGKWHLGYRRQFNPVHHGFDEFRGYVSGNVDYFSHCDRMGIADWWNGAKLEAEAGYVTHLISRHAVRYIEENRKRPFCLYVSHEAVHSPYQGPHDKPVRAVGKGRIRGAGRKDRKAAYREMLIEMDNGVGKVMEIVRRLGLAENTFVFFFSDNGANRVGSNGKLHGFKGSLWEGGHRVPAIAWWPGKIPAGTVTNETTISLDVMPTVLELAGANVPKGHSLDGTSLRGLMTGTKKLSPRTLFWEFRKKTAVREGVWKLVVGERFQRGKAALFKLDDDPGERRNLARQHPQRLAKMQRALEKWKKDVADGATVQPAK